MKIDWSYVDKVISFNLKDRKERRFSIERKLKKVGISKDKIHRFEAIQYPVGYIGCAMFHAKVMELSNLNNWGNILVLEDDFIFDNNKDKEQRANIFLKSLEHVQWNVALLSANYHRVLTLKSNAIIFKVLNVWFCCSGLVNSSCAPILYKNFTESVNEMKQGGRDNYACDVHWMRLSEQHI